MADTSPKPKLARTRSVTTWVLVVLVGILAPITVLSAWATKTVTSTDRYVETMAPLARDKAVTSYVAQRATNKLFEGEDIQTKVAEALPDRADFLAAPLTAQLHVVTQDLLTKALQSSWFPTLWDKENRFTHSNVVALLEGKRNQDSQRVHEVVVDVTPSLEKADHALRERGITVFTPIIAKLTKADSVQVQVFNSKQMAQAQGIFDLAISVRSWILAGTLVLAALAVAVAVRRRVALTRILVAVAVGAAVTLLLLTVGRNAFINHADPGGQAAAEAIFDTVMRFFRQALRTTFTIAAALAAVSWATGPTPRAITLRAALARAGSRSLEAAREAARSEQAQDAKRRLGLAARWTALRTWPTLAAAGGILLAVMAFATKTSTVRWAMFLAALAVIWVGAANWLTRREES